jgi:hypothetical protein
MCCYKRLYLTFLHKKKEKKMKISWWYLTSLVDFATRTNIVHTNARKLVCHAKKWKMFSYIVFPSVN